MVGTPRSSGCSICRKRKKKCDEQRPACRNCIAAGWRCPGYTRSWKFVDESGQLSRHYASREYSFDSDHLTGRDAPQSRMLLLKASGGQEIVPSEHGLLRIAVSWPPSSTPGEKIGSMLCHILTDPMSQRVFQLQSLSNFFQFVPSRLGYNAALDASISCLCSIFTALLGGYSTMSTAILSRYGRSIRELQGCIGSEDTRCNPNTICASIILQLCELMTCEDTGRWNTLSRGSQALIQECGPKRFQSPFERALLESQRAFFIVHNAAMGQPCFLAEQLWRDVLASPDPSLTRFSRSIALRSELCDFLIEMPDLILEITVLLSQDPPTSSSAELQYEKQALRLRNKISDLDEQLKAWYERNLHSNQDLALERSGSGTTRGPASMENDPNSTDPEGTLYWVVHCVTNAVLVKLEQLVFALDSVIAGDMDNESDVRLKTYLKHQTLAKQALETVSSRSHFAAKPLIFGLSQLWSGDGVLDSFLEAKIALCQ